MPKALPPFSVAPRVAARVSSPISAMLAWSVVRTDAKGAISARKVGPIEIAEGEGSGTHAARRS